VTLFGAVVSATGRDHVAPVFDALASSFSNCSHFELEVIAASASGNLAHSPRGGRPRPGADVTALRSLVGGRSVADAA
jgi:hypothetical protein